MVNEFKNKWRVSIPIGIKKKIKKIQPKEQARVKNKIYALRDSGTSDPDIKRLEGRIDWSLRVGRWRIVFRIDLENRTMVAINFGPRGDIYKK
ncbi:MAG: type II toxin-antitoxin system RelE/ParE family toxin [Candidatus Eremiobacteraeota bacterium]|nr:type II toxin-antitoxin system RelE/ParE family toxin [Candidatus Eremiobacteraeota bacterium]